MREIAINFNHIIFCALQYVIDTLSFAKIYTTLRISDLCWILVGYVYFWEGGAQVIKTTLAEGRAVYWSRSRNELWRKGETSGHIQKLVEFRWDCDNDAILLLVDQNGVACHTGQRSCFFNQYRANNT